MLKLGIIFGLLASIVWSATPTNCRQHTLTKGTEDDATESSSPSRHQHNDNANVNEIVTKNMENFMDTTAQPCDNFYQYACGRWSQQYIDELEFGDVLGMLDYELNKKLEHILKRVSLNGSALVNETVAVAVADDEYPEVYRKVRVYYKSCKKVKPYNLKKYLQLIRPGYEATWYLLARNGGKKWQADKFDWLEAIGKLRLYGLNGVLLKEEVLPRWDESSSNSIYLDKPNLGETEPMGQGAMIELMLDIGQTKRVANEVARKVDAFEVQLHRLHECEDEEGAKEMQLGYLQEYMPQINWLVYLQQLKGSTTNLETTVIIENIPYMRALVKLLRNVPKDTICNYIMLKFLKFLKQQGPAEISKQECVASLRRAMPLAVSNIIGTHLYRDHHHNDATVQRIFRNLQHKFDEIVSDNRLQLPKPIVQTLREKVMRMRLQIGNSPRNMSSQHYDEYYDPVELDPHNFYVNQLSLMRLAVEKLHESLDYSATNNSMRAADTNETTFVSTDWMPSSSSPFYVKPKNLIVVPYGFLQMPVYHRHMTDVFKYSVLGFSIAHELLHGFDSSGIDYDSVGNIMGPSEEIAANQRFMQGLRCMQNELVAGSKSLNEKLADYEGLRLAYMTLFHGNVTPSQSPSQANANAESKQQHHHHHHDSMEFTPRQMFFIHYAQFFCGKVHRSVRQSAYLEHALDELRVLQSLANLEEFAKAFSCERRSKMQSKNRCRLW